MQDIEISPESNPMPSKPQNQTVEQRALRLLKQFEGAGKAVSSVAIDGRRIEIAFHQSDGADEFDGIDMRHGKT